uniref:Uncharacterized protein n=1 Tax=Hippocampus comes TaxID=109280 RepID=A0A3Q3D9A5_HIPCM
MRVRPGARVCACVSASVTPPQSRSPIFLNGHHLTWSHSVLCARRRLQLGIC